MTAAFVFLAINNHVLVASNDEMVGFALEIAASEPDMSWQQIASWLRQRTVPVHSSDDQLKAGLRRLPPESQRHVSRRLREYAKAFEELEREAEAGPP